MRVPVAEFVTSAASPEGWPPDGAPELAFAGRSNVGKSSLLNVLVARKGLFKTSGTPGRTRTINFFRAELALSSEKRLAVSLVDLPGYGYAKVSKEERSTWRPTIERYLADRPSLRVVALLVDARRGAEIDERELAPWLAAHGRAVIPVLTKIDKLSKHERRPALDRFGQAMSMRAVGFSAETGEGRDELWRRLLAHVD